MKTIRSLARLFLTVAAIALGGLAPARPASAAPVTFLLQGEVTFADGTDASVAAGTPITVKLVTDPAIPDGNQDATYGSYTYSTPGYGIFAEVGNNTFESNPASPFFGVTVLNGYNSGGDRYTAETSHLLENGAPVDQGFLQFSLRDPSGTALHSDHQPTEPLTLEDFSEGEFIIHTGNVTIIATITEMLPYDLTPQEEVQQLSGRLQSLVDQGLLSSRSAKPLTTMLEVAGDRLQDGQLDSAVNLLGAFLNRLEALVNAGKISAAAARSLAEDVFVIIEGLTG